MKTKILADFQICISVPLKWEVTPFTNMNTNAQYVCHIRHEQASVNRWIGKQVIKNPPENLKNHL